MQGYVNVVLEKCSCGTNLLQSRGSPAYQYGLAPTNFITAVNGIPTPNLDSFVREVSKIPDNTYFRLRAVTFDNVPWVVTMKKNDHYVGCLSPFCSCFC